jgi:hypothetical protein
MGLKLNLFGAIVITVAMYLGALLSSGPVCPISCALLPTFVSEYYQLCPKPRIEGYTLSLSLQFCLAFFQVG